MIDQNLEIEYLKRLMSDSYVKKGETKYFIFQYLRGAGNELNAKFWSEHSSSRMAFELYSGLAHNDAVEEFEFEKQLEGPKSGGMGPNMDVYIETKDEIIFIESKFTEKADLKYINNKNETDSYLSPAYWKDAEYGKKRMPLEERLDKRFAEPFAKFCTKWEEEMGINNWRKRGTVDWFEPKQETCHLSGIFFYLFNAKNKELISNKKKIRLFNIYWDLGGEGKSEMEKAFVAKANSMIEEIISHNKEELNGIDFKIDAFSVQEMLADPHKLSPHINSFGDDVDIRLEQFREVVKNRTRKSFKSDDDSD